MVRSLWKGALAIALAGVGLVWSQQAPIPAIPTEKQATVTVYENGKALKCQIVSKWRTDDGGQAYQLKIIADGEMLTLVEDRSSPASPGRPDKGRAVSMKIFHWGGRTSS